MIDSSPDSNQQSQSDKFKDAAREAGCDEDEKAWEDRLRKVAKQKAPPGDERP